MKRNVRNHKVQPSLFPALIVTHKKEDDTPPKVLEDKEHQPVAILKKDGMTQEELDELYKKEPDDPWWNQ